MDQVQIKYCKQCGKQLLPNKKIFCDRACHLKSQLQPRIEGTKRWIRAKLKEDPLFRKKPWTKEKRTKSSENFFKIFKTTHVRNETISYHRLQEWTNKEKHEENSLKEIIRFMNKIKTKSQIHYDSIKGICNDNNILLCGNEYDKLAAKKLDSNPNVKRFSFFSNVISQYSYSKKWKQAIPIDFLVEYTTGIKEILMISKSGVSITKLEKFNLIQDYCRENNLQFQVWTEEMI